MDSLFVLCNRWFSVSVKRGCVSVESMMDDVFVEFQLQYHLIRMN